MSVIPKSVYNVLPRVGGVQQSESALMKDDWEGCHINIWSNENSPQNFSEASRCQQAPCNWVFLAWKTALSVRSEWCIPRCQWSLSFVVKEATGADSDTLSPAGLGAALRLCTAWTQKLTHTCASGLWHNRHFNYKAFLCGFILRSEKWSFYLACQNYGYRTLPVKPK